MCAYKYNIWILRISYLLNIMCDFQDVLAHRCEIWGAWRIITRHQRDYAPTLVVLPHLQITRKASDLPYVVRV